MMGFGRRQGLTIRDLEIGTMNGPKFTEPGPDKIDHIRTLPMEQGTSNGTKPQIKLISHNFQAITAKFEGKFL
jgi:hypothetical protein